MSKIRNFSIIAHIDHWKSTLADRFLELTWVVQKIEGGQVLDQMDLEQERWITIKLAPVRMFWRKKSEEGLYWEKTWRETKNSVQSLEDDVYQLNLIDTPWHVDFQYEVSRALAAVEGAILLVDATQWIQAQTLSTLHMALQNDLVIVPAINKIDLPAAQPDRVAAEIAKLLNISPDQVIRISAKTGENVEELLEAVIQKIPSPEEFWEIYPDKRWEDSPEVGAKALIFDSVWDPYRWVVSYVKVVKWRLKAWDVARFVHWWGQMQIMEVGYFSPWYTKAGWLEEGEIGYVVTGLKSTREAKVGDTILTGKALKVYEPQQLKKFAVPGFREVTPFVYAGVYPLESDEYPKLKESLEKLALNDAALVREPENIPGFGFGFRVGFLGMLHMDIVKERLRREFQIETVFTVPTVIYLVKSKTTALEAIKTGKNITALIKDGLRKEVIKFETGQQVDEDLPEDKVRQKYGKILQNWLVVRWWADMPPNWMVEKILEPYALVEIVGPAEFVGNIMELAEDYRWEMIKMDYLDADRILWQYMMPLGEIIVDFYDKLKGVTKGYASMSYEMNQRRESDLVKLDILINGERIDVFSLVVHRSKAYYRWREIVQKLKELIPKHLFPIPLQASIGTRVIARETIPALKKDVLAKCYGGDVTRKRKLLQKQKEGKKRLKQMGKVSVPDDIFVKLVSR